MNRTEDLINKQINKLIVFKQNFENGKTYCYCKCVCNSDKIVRVVYSDLKRGKTKSCGCLLKNNGIKTHGLTHTRIYELWRDIHRKCYNTNYSYYKYYGKIGIDMFEAWKDKPYGVLNFYIWALKNKYQDNLYLHRIHKLKGFYPENCLWLNYPDDCNLLKNKRTHITYNGETKTIKEWSELADVPQSIISSRVKRGINTEDLFLSKNDLLQKTILKKHQDKGQVNYIPYIENNNIIYEKRKVRHI